MAIYYQLAAVISAALRGDRLKRDNPSVEWRPSRNDWQSLQ